MKIKQRDLKENAVREISETITKINFEIAGQFGEKRFLKKLEETIKNYPVDIVDFQLNVPTVKGLKENAPGFMKFTLTSTEMEEIKKYANMIRTLTKENKLILINESK